jgi:hypothetical protein
MLVQKVVAIGHLLLVQLGHELDMLLGSTLGTVVGCRIWALGLVHCV